VGHCWPNYPCQYCSIHYLDPSSRISPTNRSVRIHVSFSNTPSMLRLYSFVAINKYWDRTSKIIILIADAGLNYYFIRVVKQRLVNHHGLTKYKPLVTYNACLMIVSILMDVSSSPPSCLQILPTFSFSGRHYRTPLASQRIPLRPVPLRGLHGET